MPYKRGDRVVAARSLGMLHGIQKGTHGVVRDVSFLGSYTVDFGSGRVLHELSRDDLSLAPLAGPVGGGCLLLVGPCLALAVAVGAALRRTGPGRRRT